MFENREPVSYAKLKDGKVEVYRGKDKDGKKKVDLFDNITATVTGIDLKEGEYQGEKILNWNIKLEDKEGALAVLSLGYSSGFTRGFFNSLVNADLTKPIRISCYVKEGDRGAFNCPSISQNNELVRWKYPDVPKTAKVKIGSKEVIDDEKAVAWMLTVIEECRNKLETPAVQKAGKAFDKMFEGSTPVDVPMPPDYGDEKVDSDLPF